MQYGIPSLRPDNWYCSADNLKRNGSNLKSINGGLIATQQLLPGDLTNYKDITNTGEGQCSVVVLHVSGN